MNTDFLIKLESLQYLSQLYEDNEKILDDFLNILPTIISKH